MDEYIDCLGEETLFTTLNAYVAYWWVIVRKEDRPKMAFVSHAGTYQYRRLQMGLRNSPVSFQRALDLILTKLKWKTCLIYIDHVIIYSETAEEPIFYVEEILSCLAEAGVALEINKCFFSQRKVK